jgi:hypothetical protein
MTSPKISSRFMRALVAATGLALAVAASPLLAAGRSTDESLTLVPTDAASVAMLRFSELRNSPLSSRLFSDADHITVDGDAARFMAEARLDPKTDVDTVTIAGLSPSGPSDGVLVIFEGRFDPDRLSAAVVARGAVQASGAGGTYYILPDKSSSASASSSRHTGAVAFVSSHLVIAGSEPAVAQALVARSAGGTAFASGAGLGRELSRVDRASSAWAIVDVTKYPAAQSGLEKRKRTEGSDTANALIGAMKSVTLFTFQATVKTDSLDLAASGVARDADTRQLLEDSLRGVVAMLRLAVQDKQPDLVPVLRRFQVSSEGDSVTISGNLPASALKTLASKAESQKRAGR